MMNIDEIMTNEYSTYIVAEVIDNAEDTYTEMLDEYFPKDKRDELDEKLYLHIEKSNKAVFEQGFIRGIAAAKGGVAV